MERRVMERYEMSLPTTYSFADNPHWTRLMTKNICSSGAYFETDHSLITGTEVFMKIQITTPENRIVDKQTFVEITGKVSRNDSKGFAVSFDNGYRFVRL